MAKPIRDNEYYRKRLEAEYPAVHADFLTGKYETLGAALIAVGIRKPRTRLHELVNAWSKANSGERDEFIDWLRRTYPAALAAPSSSALPVAAPSTAAPSVVVTSAAAPSVAVPSTASPSTATPTAPLSVGPFSTGRRLAPWAVDRIRQIVLKRNLKIGQVLVDLGIGAKPLNPSLGFALHRGTTMQQPLIDALERWVAKHAHL